MRIDIITCLPALLESPLAYSIVQRAIKKNIVQIHVHHLRDYAQNKHQQIDDKAYGGMPGMVLMVEPIARCIETLQQQRKYDKVIYMSPDGVLLNQPMANTLSLDKHLLILCGHYKGIDERIRKQWITHEISIGTYVLSGGELAAAVLVDALVRLLPGAINNEMSALEDSFQNQQIAPPVYTRPAKFRDMEVPSVLLSGNHQKIRQWEETQIAMRTNLYHLKNHTHLNKNSINRQKNKKIL